MIDLRQSLINRTLRNIEEMMQERGVVVDHVTVDFLLTAKRDLAAARRFLERAINLHDVPEKTTGSSSASPDR